MQMKVTSPYCTIDTYEILLAKNGCQTEVNGNAVTIKEKMISRLCILISTKTKSAKQ